MPKTKKQPVVCQEWIESERGWGTRPDGYSIHLTEADRVDYMKEYWDAQPAAVPDEYSRPTGNPTIIDVSPSFYRKLQKTKNGMRVSELPK